MGQFLLVIGMCTDEQVLLKSATAGSNSGRLARVLAWERLDEDMDEL